MARFVVKDWISIEDYDPIRTDADRAALREGYVFDRARAKRATDFIQRFCRARAGTHAGERIRLLPWQLELIWQLFGWVREDTGLRRFREAYIEIGKRNGKSVVISAIAVYCALADGEIEPAIYINAASREQASIVYREAWAMIEADPGLRKHFGKTESQRKITCTKTRAVLIANSADAPAKDGLDPSVVIFDELHRQPNRKLWSLFEFSQGSRRQPLLLSITTAGEDLNSVCYEQHERAVKVLSGINAATEVHFLPIIHGPWEAEDGGKSLDVDDEANWYRANPSLGYAIPIDGFRAELAKAKQSPDSLANFKRLKLGVWSNERVRFFALDGLKTAGERRSLEECLASGDRCYGAFDLSSTQDLTGEIRIFGDIEKGFDVFAKAWVPGEEAERRIKQSKAPYRSWIDSGKLVATEGRRINYDRLAAEMIADFEEASPVKVYADGYNAQLVGAKLIDAGVPFETIRQGFLSLSSPTKELERLIALGLIRIGDEEVLEWCLGNAIAERDAADNVKLSKKLSREKIDLAAALVNAIAAAMDDLIQPELTPVCGVIG